MNEDRDQQYLPLIQELLICPNGEEGNILNANMELVDLEFVAVMGQYADYLRQQGQDGAADFLVNMAAQIKDFLQPNREVNLEMLTSFCNELLRAENDGGQRAVFAALAQNLELVNENLGQALITVSQGFLSNNEDPELRELVAGLTENISTRLTDFPLGNPRGKIISAIAGYQYVLSLRIHDPEKTAQTQNNLGNAYSDLAPFSDNPKQEIERAIASYLNALRVYKEAELPQDFAMTQNNLGNAYSDLAPFSDNPKQEIERAIASFLNALRVRKEAELPQDFAMTQNNLGNAYSRLAPFSDNPKQEIERAIASFLNALRIHSSDIRSTDCLKTARNLGNLGFQQGLWETAIEGYSKAIEAVENIRRWSTNDDRRAEIHVQAIELYTNIIQAFVNLKQYDKAIEYAERSRSQRIVDLLHSNDLYPQGDIPEIVQQKLAEFQAKQSAIDILLQQLTNNGQRQTETAPRNRAITESLTAELKELENQKQIIYQELRSHDPVLAGQVKVDPLPFAKMQELLKGQSQTAILYFYITSTTTLIFVVQSHQIALHQCPDQGTELNEFLFENWLNPYLTNRSAWSQQMPTVLAAIAQRLNFNQLLKDHIPDRIQELIIVPHLYLHQIPFAALPIDPPQPPLRKGGEEREVPLSKGDLGGSFLSDRYHLRTISSLQILSYCQNREPIATSQYATVENATNDLPFAGFEGEQVAKMFQVPSDRRLIGKNAATKDNYRHLLKTNSSLLSSHHATSRIDKPLESLLQLGDGFIALGELLMSRYPHLADVFLSCCETGLGAPQNLSDDILTLATGFLCAGARSVISSLWSVDDLATALFSTYYHHYRKSGSDRPTAIYQAQKELRELKGADLAKGKPLRKEIDRYLNEQIKVIGNSLDRSDERLKIDRLLAQQLPQLAQQPFPFASPFYWAGFICQGLA